MIVAESASVAGVRFTHFSFFLTSPFLHFLAFLCSLALARCFLVGVFSALVCVFPTSEPTEAGGGMLPAHVVAETLKDYCPSGASGGLS
jgi:hypothetical protein